MAMFKKPGSALGRLSQATPPGGGGGRGGDVCRLVAYGWSDAVFAQVQAGDLIVVFGRRTTGAIIIPAPDGYTEIGAAYSGGQQQVRAFARVADGSETTVSVTNISGLPIILVYRDHDGYGPSASTLAGSGTSVAVPQIDGLDKRSLIVVVSWQAFSAITHATGVTAERWLVPLNPAGAGVAQSLCAHFGIPSGEITLTQSTGAGVVLAVTVKSK